MGQAALRKRNGERTDPGIKLTLRQQQAPLLLVHHKRIEEQGEDGTVYARNIFRVVNERGHPLVEETPDGPRPVMLISVPQPVRRTVLGAVGLVRT